MIGTRGIVHLLETERGRVSYRAAAESSFRSDFVQRVSTYPIPTALAGKLSQLTCSLTVTPAQAGYLHRQESRRTILCPVFWSATDLAKKLVNRLAISAPIRERRCRMSAVALERQQRRDAQKDSPVVSVGRIATRSPANNDTHDPGFC